MKKLIAELGSAKVKLPCGKFCNTALLEIFRFNFIFSQFYPQYGETIKL